MQFRAVSAVPCSIVSTIPRGGVQCERYFARVWPFFVLFCAALPISAEYDPSGAGTLPLNGSASGSVSEQQRTNWWTVTVPSDGKLVVETFSSAELLLYLYETLKN
jgi:hypothetical protein